MKAQDSKLERAIEQMDLDRGGRSFSDMFEDFLDLALLLMCNNPSERQKELYAKLKQDDRKVSAFQDALKAYGELAEGYHDPLGEMFMERISHGNNGQFFTPEHICDFMAEITDPVGESINDPTCGSGRLLLSGLKKARKNGQEPVLNGNDLSYTCARMTLLNLLINCARGDVSCGDGLMLKTKNFLFYHIDRVWVGTWVSTYWQYTDETMAEVNEMRNKWYRDMLSNGVLVERIPRKDEAVEAQKPFPDEPETKEQPVEQLEAKPKATAVQLDLFEQFEN